MKKNLVLLLLTTLLITSCGGFGRLLGIGKSGKRIYLEDTTYKKIPNWSNDDFTKTTLAFSRSCDAYLAMSDDKDISTSDVRVNMKDLKRICNSFRENRIQFSNSATVKSFYEHNFKPVKVYSYGKDKGRITGYYEPLVEGSRLPTPTNLTPIYGLPTNPADRNYTRKQIENGILATKAPVIFWASDPVEFWIMQVQGGGELMQPNGSKVRLAYAGNNNQTFKGMGTIMKENHITPYAWSMVGMRAWLQQNPARAKELMQQNKRYIYYKEINGPGPVGSMGVPLVAKRSIAVDKSSFPLGLPFFINFNDENGAKMDRLVMGQDVGSAIQGTIRADFFWGSGEQAFQRAGKTNAQGGYFLLLPR